MRYALMCLLLLFATPAKACMASYYSGGRTANGGHVGPMTAAHKTLPFGTKVRVYCQRRSVTVTINDRGPFVKGRCIDLSPDAASVLNMKGKGVINVLLDVLGK